MKRGRPSQQRLSIALAFWPGRRRRHYAEEHRILAGVSSARWAKEGDIGLISSQRELCVAPKRSSRVVVHTIRRFECLEVVVATLNVVYEPKRAPALTALAR